MPSGVNRQRLALLLAVLGKHTDMRPYSVDVHLNVTGGERPRIWHLQGLPVLVPRQTAVGPPFPPFQSPLPGLEMDEPSTDQADVCAPFTSYPLFISYPPLPFLPPPPGLEMNEPSTDLAVVCAIASSYFEQPIARDVALIGEVGLGGELRPVGNIERRIAEAAKVGGVQ